MHSLLPTVFTGLFLFFSASAFAQSMSNEGYQVTQVDVEPYIQAIKRTGKVNFRHTLNLSFKTAGFLTKLNVDEGDTFEAEQLLAALDTSELKANKNSTYARLLQAKRNVNRIQTLLAKKLSSQRELDDALTAVETTRSVYRIAVYNLDKAQVFAPFSGVVVQRNTELGELQSPGKAALQVAALEHNLIVSVALTSDEIGFVRLNQKVQVHIARFGLIEGVISKIPAISNSSNHLFTIEVLLPETSFTRPLIVGQLAKILIHSQSHDFVYRLPIEALNAVNDQGQALIVLEKKSNPIQQAFPIYKIDNDYLYLQAVQSDLSLKVITQGWNKLSLISTEK
ncbi:efflux RND transporter periplasmic adaptor subunit [Candidatus Colwellia aromaticivorans]|uniref:efflux RND transporter periplasmic adaptor subunit n=1 Tax=Candidatus Colwellia aromaticivorans TaxID=2267621 RepID=UPI001FE75178|nr:efflux RND transporter periplasmic adaptor subunit [Candidatus Colwellia aromaticivorans]